jgi:hypothetical protein
MLSPDRAFPYVLSKRTYDHPGQISDAGYDEASRTFHLRMTLKKNEKQAITIAGFRNLSGVIAEPVNLSFQTGSEEMDENTKAAVAKAASNPELLKLLANIREKRQAITSVVERAQYMQLNREDGLFISISCKRFGIQMAAARPLLWRCLRNNWLH